MSSYSVTGSLSAMAESAPKVSIVTASYNSADTLPSCFDSIAAQTYDRIEHVVVDGASTDESQSIIAGHARQPERYISEPDNGVYDALNKGIALATGDVIGFLHSDDVYASPVTIAKVARCFQAGAQAVYGDLQYVASENTEHVIRHWIAGSYSARQLRLGWMPPHPTLFVRRGWYERLGDFDDSYRIAADYHFILRLFKEPDFQAEYLPEVLVKMRVGGVSNRSLSLIIKKSREDLHALRRTGVGGMLTLISKNLRKITQFVR